MGVLLVSHGLVLMELHRLLGELSPEAEAGFGTISRYIYNIYNIYIKRFGTSLDPRSIANTAVSEYSLQLDPAGNIAAAQCNVFACSKHLQDLQLP